MVLLFPELLNEPQCLYLNQRFFYTNKLQIPECYSRAKAGHMTEQKEQVVCGHMMLLARTQEQQRLSWIPYITLCVER